MAKFWTAGSVKTRLGQRIGMHQSARLHKLFVQVLTQALAKAGDHRVAVVTPTAKAKRFGSQISTAWTVDHQSEGDLGQRMMAWFIHSLQRNQSAILIGGDCPLIDVATIQNASDQLARHDIVLGPAIDGGYYLIGLRGPWDKRFERLFVDMPWSSDQVLSITQQRSADAGLRIATINPREDIDTVEALDRLRAWLRESNATSESHRFLHEQIQAILDDPWEDDSSGDVLTDSKGRVE
ncbi:2-phospho-L-lactate guanylyltransferase [Planctomycetes bacterium K23_9]|uniref:2-phospho-L-lactate guanylyltransferase n=2 Tax=Stieleria marina TaxID=1930275 RepID=A0A517NNA3_9BACT|nr:2-phospho-L-lactate guanylyltransferase [Planctomycetes bacterium K23_9]